MTRQSILTKLDQIKATQNTFQDLYKLIARAQIGPAFLKHLNNRREKG